MEESHLNLSVFCLIEKMNNNGIAVHFCYSPREQKIIYESRQVFWLAFFLITFPSIRKQTVVCSTKSFLIKAYSCGYSSGFAPDSLFITHSWQGTGNTEKLCKDRYFELDNSDNIKKYWLKSRRIRNNDDDALTQIYLFLFRNKFSVYG